MVLFTYIRSSVSVIIIIYSLFVLFFSYYNEFTHTLHSFICYIHIYTPLLYILHSLIRQIVLIHIFSCIIYVTIYSLASFSFKNISYTRPNIISLVSSLYHLSSRSISTWSNRPKKRDINHCTLSIVLRFLI